ncbi:LuxR C-terminal-related transcriptional regulator [Bradyrhizobium sp. CB3481]|uniref:response regulator transcription factor n=1 Tax=Bradyrhizobium sp. CB3481 TaxID=3039158 RepID=UPI0024B12BC1|nr:LuxR C-terminal-related transcriptional regulator [Bradyrhizobium sp. CB3481]WFU14521.1 LuxR C-terminal-related transcriptional regulator [Bradyrhizobium sp. CB3481]
MACLFHIALAEIAQASNSSCNSKVTLSDREKDCLRWAAEGKTSWEIGMILKISDNTANFHFKNVNRKLCTTNRTQAIVKAVRHNLI